MFWEFPGHNIGRRIPSGAQQTQEFGRQSLESRKSKISIFQRTKYQRGERFTKRVSSWNLQRVPFETFSSVLISWFMWGHYPRLGKICWKELEGRGLELTQGQKQCLFSPAQLEKLVTHGSCLGFLGRSCSVMGKCLTLHWSWALLRSQQSKTRREINLYR